MTRKDRFDGRRESSLRLEIVDWDGKSAAAIAAIYDRYADSADLPTVLIRLAAEPECELGATWLLKRYLESGGTLTQDQIMRWYTLVPKHEHWGACLHVLQCMPRLEVPKAQAPNVATFLDRCLTSRRPMVRAWAYTGYHELAKAHPKYRQEADNLLADAAKSETAGSIRVRVRKALEDSRP